MRCRFGQNGQLGLVVIMTESIDGNLPAIAGFTLGLFFAGLWLTDTFLLVTYNFRLSNSVGKWFCNRPIVIPALFFLFFPFFTARIFDSLWVFLNQDTPSLPESSEKFGVILKVLPPVLGAVVGGTIGFTSSYLMWTKQNRFNQKNLARALYLEISRLEEHLKKLLEHDSLVLALPIYSGQGLFFIFTKEISFFEHELSSKIFDFYGWLNQAENIRQIDTEKVAYGVVGRQANRLIETKKWLKTNELLSEVAEEVMKTGNNAVVNREAVIEQLYNPEYSKMIEGKIYLIKDYLRKAYPYIQILKQLLQNEFDSCPKSD
jgi:hypothetical protein